MNRELMLKVADQIERHPSHFNIGSWTSLHSDAVDGFGPVRELSCGTTACVAGWAVILGPKITKRTPFVHESNWDGGLYIDSWDQLGAQRLGISIPAAEQLFHGYSNFWVDQAGRRPRRRGASPEEGAFALTAKGVANVLRDVASGKLTLLSRSTTEV